MNGKDKCSILKQIRRDIAEKNDIALTIAECTHKGDCAGTCPRCESEVRALERALADRRKQGKRVVVAGISAGLVAASCASCEFPWKSSTELDGDMRASEDSSKLEETSKIDEQHFNEQENIVTLQGDVPYTAEDDQELPTPGSIPDGAVLEND